MLATSVKPKRMNEKMMPHYPSLKINRRGIAQKPNHQQFRNSDVAAEPVPDFAVLPSTKVNPNALDYDNKKCIGSFSFASNNPISRETRRQQSSASFLLTLSKLTRIRDPKDNPAISTRLEVLLPSPL